MAEQRIVKWGIMGPGGISDNFATELPHAPGAELVAVAGRSLDKAQAFAEKFGIPRAYGSCEELAADPDVEIVYVGTLHPIHKENALTLLRGGKSVLCEKPFTINAAEAKEIADLARQKGLFLMEAMWTRYLPAIVKVREWLDSGAIGDVRIVKAEFGFDAGWNPEGRLLNKEKGGGTLLDAGIYPVSFASMVYGGEQPSTIKSSVLIGETGVDEQFSLLFEYGGGRTASLHSSIRLSMTNEAVIYGTKGRIEIPGFLFAKSATLHVNGEEPVVFKHELEPSGHFYQAIEAMECLREGRKESPVMTVDETVRIMETLDRIREPWGLKYPSEA
ncbi:putative dehydrogenase [Paenibacillus cellulosilyticus]|uniref:Putative dehydrogenase n=1 Tax=Paenibacillus cellulosilyticus TaxID=375489 RepID=A0A2V2YTE7_9BACL|nr:Gfo/Idh/MocA family oxidoreductase [Paenibacillus cellulosilyticus]PWW02743.1 putative dehydrogenase [Paenibacillus cellulosilyticus]QKS45668.1 Gfo/Idh/MocA family oxidoreductase [Paenibacillus cellulosilyticus]